MKNIFKYIILIFIISIGIGFILAKGKIKYNKVSIENSLYNNFLVDNNIITNEINNNIDILETSFEDDKIEIDTKLILKKKYIDCKHTITKEVELPGELINLTEEELKVRYPEWKIEEFDDDEVVLYKNVYGLCTEHFVIESGEEFIEVYSLNEEYDKKLYEVTNISIEYLTEDDIEKLNQGIYVYGVQELNSILENFE